MKFIELFAGIGGFRLGLERAGHTCVWANEFERKASRIYERNFDHKPDGRDIRDVQPDEIPDADLLCGGFPCATFSVAGRRSGFSTEDTRGTLFFEICRILRGKRIPYIFLENVKGLLNHDGGRTFGVIIASLDELGYDLQWECVNSKNFGVPQNRERVFIIGSLRGTPRPKVFPIGCVVSENDGKAGEGQVETIGGDGNTADGTLQWRRSYFRENNTGATPTLTANMGLGGHNVPFVTGKVMETRDVFPTLDAHYWKGVGNNQGRGTVQVRPVLTPNRPEKRQNGRRIKDHNEPAFTLTAQDRHGILIEPDETSWRALGVRRTETGKQLRRELTDKNSKGQGLMQHREIYAKQPEEPHSTISANPEKSFGVTNGTQLRKLTPLECERLQSLPDNWTKWYEDGSLVPDAQRYERCGRAVTVNVIYEIAKRLPI